MKLNKKTLHQQRRQLDEKLKGWNELAQVPRPRSGWLKPIREALGMTTRQLAALLETNNGAVLRMEKREAEGKVTLDTLNRAAEAMGCRVVYAIVPNQSLERIVDQRADDAAQAILNSLSHSMKLEKQEVTPKVAKNQREELARELKLKLDSALWEKKK
ncbi:MAG: mobile mystery protein A [Methylotenera sp.]|nr:mobile mystery protein A [Oligoflexia bacterium]